MANPTYLDFANTLDPNDKVATIIELQNETNEILTDMVCKEGNLMTGHKTTVRTGLPSSTWRLLNYGVQPSKSQSTPVTDVTGMLEAYAEIDKELADLNGNASAFRLTEDRAFLESMNQEMAETLFYGNVAVDPEKFARDLSQRLSRGIQASGLGRGNSHSRRWRTLSGIPDSLSVEDRINRKRLEIRSSYR